MKPTNMRYDIILALPLCLLVLSYSKVNRIKQVRTYADMQTITYKIEALREQGPNSIRNAVRMRSLILDTFPGRDAWKHDFLYFTKTTGADVSYVLVSTGSDGKSDVADPQEYFIMPERVVHDEPWRDIVFRDGHPITRAGK